VVDVASKKTENITTDNKGWDSVPVFSPDGKSLAIASMARPQYEADRARLTVVDLASKKKRVVTEAWDRSVGEIAFSQDGKTVFTTSDDVGNKNIFAIDVASGTTTRLTKNGSHDGAEPVAGSRIVYSKDTLKSPAELYTAKLDGTEERALTSFNKARVDNIAWGEAEQFSFTGAKGEKVFGYIVKPANYKSGKVPLAFLIHGGPQGSFGDHFHYRWNPQAYAGHGYATVFIDFHGSTGYGQAFTDAINNDWGGAPFEDLMKGLDHVIAKYDFVDANRMIALGASYGGYMINWINGHTDRFKALVCHDGNIDERMAYFDTEELWFPEFDHGGLPWEKPENYSKHNPVDFVKNWKTPTLVIHGGKDFRVVETQGMGTFTALQRKGVPSRFLYLPDENHWVLKPQNSRRWHDEVFRFIDPYGVKKR
jgi:dipeptidyl aminopeptidase/acylaminoacyl peptidase